MLLVSSLVLIQSLSNNTLSFLGVFNKSNLSLMLDNMHEFTSFLSEFTLIIASNLEEALLMKVSALCSSLHIPLVAVRAYGLIGCCRIQTSGKRHHV